MSYRGAGNDQGRGRGRGGGYHGPRGGGYQGPRGGGYQGPRGGGGYRGDNSGGRGRGGGGGHGGHGAAGGFGGGTNESITQKDIESISKRVQNVEIGRKRVFKTAEEVKELELRNYEIVRTRSSNDSKMGTSGRPIKLIANYFRLKRPDCKVFKYRVDFNDAHLEDQTRAKIYLVNQHVEKLPRFICDGNMIFTTTRISLGQDGTLTLHSRWGKENESSSKMIELTLRCVGECDSSDEEFIHFYNIIMRAGMKFLKLESINRNLFDPHEAIKFPAWNLQLWPGYATSIRQQESGLMLCAEIVSKILRTDSALAYIKTCIRQNMSQDVVKKSLIGAVVVTPYNNKHYRVADVDFTSTPKSTFTSKGVDISYVDYFKNKYKVTISDMNQPMLVSYSNDKMKRRQQNEGESSQVLLAPELTMMTGLLDSQRENFKLNNDLAEYTRADPKKRVESLRKFAKRLTTTKDVGTYLKNFDVEINPELVEVTGRMLDLETVFCKNETRSHNCDWTNEIQKGLFQRTALTKWAAIVPKRDEDKFLKFLETMKKDSHSLQFSFTDPKIETLDDTKISSYLDTIQSLIDKGAHFFFIVIPTVREDLYSAVKKRLCSDYGLPSQVITCQKILNKDPFKYRSLSTKIMIQMATKIGAVPWIVKIPFKKAKTMVVGYDCFHRKDGFQKRKSVAALVASYDQNLGQYCSKTVETDTSEICDAIGPLFEQCLHTYNQKNGALPEKVFFYRDGVGEGQLKQIFEIEVAAVRKILPPGCKLTFIVVTKRLNTRFIDVTDGEYRNPPPGTVIDDVVTRPERYDFFLVSQNVRQGTVNPTAYNVIHDENLLGPDRTQLLTYKLTHLYFNMSSTIRVPAPCMYAHKCAEFVGNSLRTEAHHNLQDTLYYL